MELLLFHFTLIVLLASILASATCLSAYLVSRKRMMLLAFVAFLFYFFDVAWVFQDDFVTFLTEGAMDSFYVVARSVASIIAGGGFLVSFWLIVCDYLGETRRAVLVAPGIVFVLGSVLALVLVPERNVQRFVFYSMRALMLFWMLLYIGIRFAATKSDEERARLKRHGGLYAMLWVLGIAVVASDANFFLLVEPATLDAGVRTVGVERNYMENLLMLIVAFVAARDAVRTLALRFERPLVQGGGRQEELINQNHRLYGNRHQLSERELEVLYYVLLGNDNQNIASTMHLALSTVKVHVHNILHKTGQADRRDLIRDFWKT